METTNTPTENNQPIQVKENTMSDNNEQDGNVNQTSSQATLKTKNIRQSRGRKPDNYYQAVTRDGDTTYWEDIGATWNGKRGYAKGTLIIDGKKIDIVVQTYEARERALSKFRQQKRVAPVDMESNHTPAV
jgi:hypothetical protein